MELEDRNTLEYLNGPVSWYEFLFKDDNGNEKMIHLFGDKHIISAECEPTLKCMKSSKDEKSNCYDFIYFLEELFDVVKENKMYADLFVEIPYILKSEDDLYKNIKANTVIGKIFDKFKYCIKRDKKKCTYLPNIRMHFSDIRTILLSDDVMDPIMAMLKGKEKRKIDPINSLLDLLKYMIHDLFAGIINSLIQINQIKIELNNQTKIVQPNINPIESLLYPIAYDEIALRINMIKILFMILENFCDLITIIISSEDYISDLNTFLNQYIDIIQSNPDVFIQKDIKEFDKVIDRLRKIKHPKSKSSIVAHQLLELEKDKIIVNGKNIAILINKYITDSCTQYISQESKIQNIIYNFDEFISQVFTQTDEGFDLQPKFDKKYHSITSQQDLKSFYSFLEKNSSILLNIFNKFMVFYDEIIITLEARLLDAFILSRLFRSFSSSKSHSPSVLAIIYSGALHTRYQVEFFKEYLGLNPIHQIEDQEGKKKDYQCLHNKSFGKIFSRLQK